MSREVANGADSNARGKDGMSLIEWEMLRGGILVLRDLLRLGATPTRRDGTGEMPCMLPLSTKVPTTWSF
mgnify:CR=1 FL=1